MSAETMKEAARRYHALGFATLPIRPGTKEPATPHGVKDATRDDAETDAWYDAHPDHGIGVSGEGFAIFDFDVHGGVDGRDEMEGWKLPDTMAQTTPSGGYHLFYRAEREVRPSVNTALAVDVRGWGSYVVADPTPGYTLESDEPPADADEAVWAFLDHVRPAAKAARKPSAKGAISEGGRNDELFRLGRSLRSAGKEYDEILAFLAGNNTVRCKPPLPASEVEKIAQSVCSVPPGHSEEVKRAERFDHVAVANELLTKHGACYLDGAPAVYAGMRYRIGWDAMERAVLDVRPRASKKNRAEVIDYLRLTMPHEQQADPRYIAFENGVLDVATMDFMSLTPDLRIPNVIPHDWNPDARSAILDETMRRIACGDPYVESNLFEFLGLCMTRSASYGYAAVLLGKQGDGASNGKSTYIKLISAVLGRENYSALDLAVVARRFQAQQVMGKLANLGDDIGNEFVRGNDLATVKKIITGEDVYSDVKGGRGLTFKPYCTMVFSANRFPRLGDDTEGVMRRLFPIRFNAKFSPDDPDFDPDISRKLAQEGVVQAAIVRGVAGLRRVMEQRHPTPNADSAAILDGIRLDNSSVLQWMEDEGIGRAELVGWETKSAFEVYGRWCEGSYMKPLSRRSFGREVADRLNLRTSVTSRNGRSVRVYAEATD